MIDMFYASWRHSEGPGVIDRYKVSVFGLVFYILMLAGNPLRAELFLAVDFDINAAGIQDKAIVDANGKTTAWLVLFLTGNTQLYAYQFSVRYNSDRLFLKDGDKDDTPPINVNGKSFKENLTNDQTRIGANDGDFEHYIEINYFDGEIDGPGYITPNDTTDGLVLGVLNFEVRGSGDAFLIKPGVYDPYEGQGADFEPFDVFFGRAGPLGDDEPIPLSPNSFQGGSIVAVPEPSSLLLVTAVAGVCCIGYLRAITGGTKKQVSS